MAFILLYTWKLKKCFCVFSLNSLKLECDKLASEKSEMQRHYIMVSLSPSLCDEPSYQLNQSSFSCLQVISSVFFFRRPHLCLLPLCCVLCLDYNLLLSIWRQESLNGGKLSHLRSWNHKLAFCLWKSLKQWMCCQIVADTFYCDQLEAPQLNETEGIAVIIHSFFSSSVL